jgi:hypothetical protein
MNVGMVIIEIWIFTIDAKPLQAASRLLYLDVDFNAQSINSNIPLQVGNGNEVIASVSFSIFYGRSVREFPF